MVSGAKDEDAIFLYIMYIRECDAMSLCATEWTDKVDISFLAIMLLDLT